MRELRGCSKIPRGLRVGSYKHVANASVSLGKIGVPQKPFPFTSNANAFSSSNFLMGLPVALWRPLVGLGTW